MDDETNNYVTLAFCGKESDTRQDNLRGSVWWYDGDYASSDRPFWIVDETTEEQTYACGNKGMYMRGIEVDISISLQASPDWLHTKWDLVHDTVISSDYMPGTDIKGQPMFDYTAREDCCNDYDRCCDHTCRCGEDYNLPSNKCLNVGGSTVDNRTSECKKPNPCGKADELYHMWAADIHEQLYGKSTHMLMTACQKNGKWGDEANNCSDPLSTKCKTPSWTSQGSNQLGFALFEPVQFSNSIWDHIEWDKAPRDVGEHQLGDGEGYEPFKFSQCCTTVSIAPQI